MPLLQDSLPTNHLGERCGRRMKKKILGAQEALEAGVKRVIIADGRVEKPIQLALSGKGTVIG